MHAREVTKHEEWGRVLDPYCVSILNTMIELTDAEAVITSSWKHAFPLAWMVTWLKRTGLHAHDHIIGTTPTDSNDHRSVEISRWLMKHRTANQDRNYVVLDVMDVHSHRDHLVRVDQKTGLLESHIGDVVRILRKSGTT